MAVSRHHQRAEWDKPAASGSAYTRLRRLAATGAHGLVHGIATTAGGAALAALIWWIQRT